MENKEKKRLGLMAIISLFIIVFLLTLMGGMYKTNIKLKLENQRIDSIMNERGQTIAVQEAVILKSEQDIKGLKEYSDSIFALSKKQERRIKDIITYYESHTKVVIKDSLIPYIDTVSIKNWEDSVKQQCASVIKYYEDSSIKVPRIAEKSSEHYYAKINVKKEGVEIDSLSLIDSQYIRFVTVKGGLFKKDTYGKRHFWLKRKVEVQVLHSNPLISISGQKSAITLPKEKPKILQKIIFIGTGILIGTKL